MEQRESTRRRCARMQWRNVLGMCDGRNRICACGKRRRGRQGQRVASTDACAVENMQCGRMDQDEGRERSGSNHKPGVVGRQARMEDM